MRHFKREFVGRCRDRGLSGIMHSKDGKNSATKDNQEYISGGYPFNRWMTNDMFFIGSDNLNMYLPILTRQNWTFSQFYSLVYQRQARPFSSMIRHLLIMQTRGPDCFFLRSYITEREGNTFQMQTRSVFWLHLDFSNTKMYYNLVHCCKNVT